MTNAQLEIESLLTDAQERTGLQDYGHGDFREGLAALVQTYENNQFTDDAVKKLKRRMADLLQSRLQVEEAWKRHPQVLAETIKRPLFLTGLPRTGTSALLNVLANDPATRELKLWEAHNPAPLEGLEPGQEDPRYLQVKAYYEQMNASSDFKKIHYMTADSAEECIFLTNHSFQDAAYGFEIFLEPYASYYRDVDRRPQYEYHANLLRLLQWQRPADRWLLKAPSHLGHLDIILDLHPQAGVIITHRNPLEVVGSYSSMMMAVLPEQTQVTDPHEMGRRVLDDLGAQMDHAMAVRERLSPGQVVDVQYTDFISDTVAVVEDIYQQLDLPYTEDVQQLIASYVADHPRNKHGSHDYQLAQFGLTEQQVLDRFAHYIETYNIKV